jgi:phage/plasmid primase-like uncharacterized protein
MTLPAELVDRARQADLLATAQSLGGARLRRVTSTEWAGPCLKCGGDDRFSVNTKKQVWHCRGCALGGADAISLVMHVRGLDFRGSPARRGRRRDLRNNRLLRGAARHLRIARRPRRMEFPRQGTVRA